MIKKPPSTAGLRHVALFVSEFEACLDFYTQLLDMQVEWHPDPDNIYLSSGCDNLALHRLNDDDLADRDSTISQRLDHIGFIIPQLEQVDEWYAWLEANGVEIVAPPRTHRDGARSFYCRDPDGTVVQVIYHPPISGLRFS